MGALRPLAGLLDEGATRASDGLPAARDCSALHPLLPAPRCLLAVLLVVAGFWVPRRVIAVNGTRTNTPRGPVGRGEPCGQPGLVRVYGWPLTGVPFM